MAQDVCPLDKYIYVAGCIKAMKYKTMVLLDVSRY